MRNIIFITVACISLISVAQAKSSFSIMTYNVENLFDTEHDPGKEDWTYLSLEEKLKNPEALAYCNAHTNDYFKKICLELDWSQDVIDRKIDNLSQVILSYEGVGADIVVFQEIENMKIMLELNKKGLAGKGYKYFSLIEGPDTRGIDVGIMSKYPIKSEKYHKISMRPYSNRETRGILEAEFKIGGKSVTVFANHWPSQGNVDQTRLAASKVLKKAALKSKSDIVIATGDFNTLHDDKPHGIKMNILPIFEDIEVKARRAGKLKLAALGTHWYRGEWSSIDKIFILKESLKSKKASIDYNSFQIIFEDFMLIDIDWTDYSTGTVHKHRIPNRFDPTTQAGFSDHLPVAVRVRL